MSGLPHTTHRFFGLSLQYTKIPFIGLPVKAIANRKVGANGGGRILQITFLKHLMKCTKTGIFFT